MRGALLGRLVQTRLLLPWKREIVIDVVVHDGDGDDDGDAVRRGWARLLRHCEFAAIDLDARNS